MSDVIVSTTESTTNVTTTNDVTTIAITDTVVEVSQATAGLQGPPGSNSDPIYIFVRNATGAQLNKGTIVYVSGANGTHTQVSLAIATGDVTSARTLGWLVDDIANNATGLCCISGYLDGVNTQGVTEGAQLYLSPTVAGGFTQTKPSAPNHMVYVGICAKASAGNGRVFVHIQNGAELEELHDVKIVSPQNNDLLRYVSGTALWENVAATAITVGSAVLAGTAVFASTASTASNAGTASYATNAGTSVYATTSGTSVYSAQSGTATYATVAGSVVNSGTANYALLAGTASYATASGSATNAATATYAVTSGTSVTISGSITRSQVSDYASGTVASAGTAQQAGTAVFASTSGTATYATTSGTAVTISGTITTSQVSDFASGTVANISGTVTQSQVSGLSSSLAGKANLSGGNSFAGAQVIVPSTISQVPLTVQGTAAGTADLQNWVFSNGTVTARISSLGVWTVNALTSTGGITSTNGVNSTGINVLAASDGASIPLQIRAGATPSVNVQEWDNSAGAVQASIDSNFRGNFPRVTAGSTADLGYAILSVNTGATATMGLVVRGVASQGTPFIDIQNNAGNSLFRVNNSGFAAAAFGIIGGGSAQASGANNTLYSTGTASVGLVVRGVASQSANLQEWQTSSGSTALRVNSTGQLALNTASNLAQLTVVPASTATVGVVVQGLSGQSANLQEWQNSGGTVVGRMDGSGNLIATTLRTLNLLTQIGEQNSGSFMLYTRATAQAASPGADKASLYFRTGTNAGTLKLVVRAGTAGAETTILDNIPT